ncbi:Small-subunit processome, Utp14 [Phytophthora cactorum]|nr:Small-subunit processome, Utp14 [Phytophthora cactorum]
MEEDDDDEEGDAASRLQKRLEKQASALVTEIDEDSAEAGRNVDKAAVDRALAGGALQTASVSMTAACRLVLRVRLRIDLGDGGSGVALANGGKKQGKELELGVKTKEKTVVAETQAKTDTEDADMELLHKVKRTHGCRMQLRRASAVRDQEEDTEQRCQGRRCCSYRVSRARHEGVSKEDAGIATLTNGSKNSKKRKLDSLKRNPRWLRKKNKKAKKQDKTTAQDELVRRAFEFVADEEDELAQEKDRLASQDADAKKGAEIAKLVGMSGWGSWAGDGVRVSKRQVAREQKAKEVAREAKQKALAGRKDARLERVLINEKKDKKAAKFTVKDVPYPFTSRADPKIMKHAGTSIAPLVLSKEDRKQAKKELSLKRKAKF